MALQPAVVDMSLSITDQTPSSTMGPLGRLKRMINAQVRRYLPHYQGAQGVVPAKIKVEPRDAFNSLPATARSVINGDLTTVTWDKQRLLAELDSQIVSICGGSQPRVFNGTTWSAYQNQILTQKLEQEVFHTSQRTIQAPDSAWLNGVTCSVWTETTVPDVGPVTMTYVGFKADNGAWIVQPSVLGTSGGLQRPTMAKVVTDGSVFWVVFNGPESGSPNLNVYAFDGNGAFLAGTTLSGFLAVSGGWPGFWDIVAAPSVGGHTLQIATPVLVGNTPDSGVSFKSFGWNGTAIIFSSTDTDATIHCSGPLAWITNDIGNGLAYLATIQSVGDFQGILWAYEVTSRAQTHQYGTGITTPGDSFAADTLAGYTFADGNGVGVILSLGVGLTVAGTSPTGPKHDPARRSITSYQVERTGTTTTLRTTQMLAQVTRAFAVDGNYYVGGYYQGGGGLTWQPTKVTPAMGIGDSMVGAATQPVAVAVGDSVVGSAFTDASEPSPGIWDQVFKSGAQGAASVSGGDSAVAETAAGYGSLGIPDGTPLLRWTLSGITGKYPGSRINFTGTSAYSGKSFDILFAAAASNIFWTPVVDTNNDYQGPATFTAGGTFTVTAMTQYMLSSIDAQAQSAAAMKTFIGGTIVVSGAGHSGNNGTFTIARISGSTNAYPNTAGNPHYQAHSGGQSTVWVVATGGQTTAADSFSAVLTPQNTNTWTFAGADFDSSYVGTDLVISNNTDIPTNVGSFPITSVPGPTQVVTSGATSLIGQTFEVPFPDVSIQLTTQIPYTFSIASLVGVIDYTYLGAIVLVAGASISANNGTYKIVQVNADGSFVALPTNGLSNQMNELLGSATITIFVGTTPAPEFQSTWFLVPLTGTQPVAGRFEYGLAYADWRREGDQGTFTTAWNWNLFPQSVSSPQLLPSGWQIVLPYRAENVTSTVVQVTAAGDVDVGDVSFSSTVGLKQFFLNNDSGHGDANSGELLIPGPMASVYTASGFLEDNINLAPEQPFLVSQSTAAAGTLGLTPGSVRIYVVVFEQTDENGNRIYSPPSPALVVNMSGANNVATIGGRVIFPLDSTGAPVANTYGPTTRNVTISIYATAFVNGVPTAQHYKITNDLYANGLAPESSTSPSGFSFPDSFTWNFVDQTTDSEIQANEVLYTDKAYLPRYPAPAFSAVVGSWRNREWVIGYDGAIWMSGEKTEGDAIWFNPAFRIVLPTDDEPLGLAAMEDYLIVTCANSVWYLPAQQFPDATGLNGSLPTPVRLPFQNGTVSGFTQTIREGVAYDSTAGGVWLITRNLDNVWLSHDVQDSLSSAVTGLSLDQAQRLFVLQASGPIMVYDGIPAAWYEWNTPTTGILLSTYKGQAVYQDAATVNVVVPGQAADVIAGTTTGIAPDITLADLNIGNVRGLKRVWEFQAVGEYLGPHRVNVVLSYPGIPNEPDTVFAPFTPAAGEPYVLPFNPTQETADSYGLRIYADFVGIGSPGKTFALEMVSAQVGMDSGVGLAKLPEGVTLVAS